MHYLVYSVPHGVAFTVSCTLRGCLALAVFHTFRAFFPHSLVHAVVYECCVQGCAQSQQPHFPFSRVLYTLLHSLSSSIFCLLSEFPYSPCHTHTFFHSLTTTCHHCMHSLQNPVFFATFSHLLSAPFSTVSLLLSLGCVHRLFTVTYFCSNFHSLNSGLWIWHQHLPADFLAVKWLFLTENEDFFSTRDVCGVRREPVLV